MRKFKNQKELFLHVWETRPHVSEISGEPLLPINHPQWHWQMLHCLPKGSYPEYKLREENIILGTVKEHETEMEHEYFRSKREELTREYYKEFYNKKF